MTNVEDLSVSHCLFIDISNLPFKPSNTIPNLLNIIALMIEFFF